VEYRHDRTGNGRTCDQSRPPAPLSNGSILKEPPTTKTVPTGIGTVALLVQLAFVYRDAAETERQNVPPGRLGSTGVHSPGCSGKGTPVCGRRRGSRGNVRYCRICGSSGAARG